MIDLYLMTLLVVIVIKVLGHILDLIQALSHGEVPGSFGRDKQPGA